MKLITLVFLTLFFSLIAFAQDAAPSPVAAASAIDGWTAWIQTHILASLASIGLVVEILVRYIPSDKPRSVLLVASAIIHSLGSMLDAVSKVLDGLLQNTTKP